MNTFLTGLGFSTDVGSSKAENDTERKEAIHCLILLQEEWQAAENKFYDRARRLFDSIDLDVDCGGPYEIEDAIQQNGLREEA